MPLLSAGERFYHGRCSFPAPVESLKRLLPCLLAIIAGCAANPAGTSRHQDSLLRDHPLSGRIFDVDRREPITKQTLFDRMTRADYLLLGEIHDNIVHHDIQREIIENLAGRGRRVSVSFEMIDLDQGEGLQKKAFTSADALVDYLEDSNPGWGYRKYYAGVIRSAFDAGYQILPANIERGKLMEMTRGGTAIDPGVRQMLDQVALTEHDLAHAREDIADSHCGYLVESMVPPMVAAQRFRDAVMALSMINSDTDLRVLVAGTGHARKDRGVPRFVRARDPDATTISLGIMEVSEDASTLGPYMQAWDHDTLPFDYVWFTPRAQRNDPCEDMRLHMEKRDSGDPGTSD